jgi:hypothetical protein
MVVAKIREALKGEIAAVRIVHLARISALKIVCYVIHIAQDDGNMSV